MLLEKFSLPKPDERLITIDNTIFKIRIHLVKHPKQNEKSYEEFYCNPKYQEDIEKILIVLLMLKDDPHPITTDNLTVYPYRKKWPIADKLRFYRHGMPLKTYPYDNYFYIEPKQAAFSKKLGLGSRVEKRYDDTSFEDNQTTLHNKIASTNNQGNKTTRLINELKAKTKEKVDEKNNDSRTAIDTSDEVCTQRKVAKKGNNPAPSSMMDNSDDDETGSEENQSISVLDGKESCVVSSAENTSLERISISSDEEEMMYSTTEKYKDDCDQHKIKKKDEQDKKSYKTIKLIPAFTRKRHGEIIDEGKPKKKSFTVTEYIDANRHEVQEQDLQELLRFQQLATPAEEKPTTVDERRESSLHNVISSVKKLMFG